MSDTLIQQHLGQRQRYWVHDAYENSATPLGDDEWWDLTLEPAGVAAELRIEIVHAYTNELISLIAIEGPWPLVESNSSTYTITVEQPTVRLVQGQAAAMAAWQQPQITLSATATSIQRRKHPISDGAEA
jgi:hypothetical protein